MIAKIEDIFQDDNIIGIKNTKTKKIFPVKYSSEKTKAFLENKEEVFWKNFKNYILAYDDYEIVYAIKVDFNTERFKAVCVYNKKTDTIEIPKPPIQLKQGMFITVNDGHKDIFGYVDIINDLIVYQDGGYDRIEEVQELINNKTGYVKYIFNKNVHSFYSCEETLKSNIIDNILWSSGQLYNCTYYDEINKSCEGSKFSQKCRCNGIKSNCDFNYFVD